MRTGSAFSLKSPQRAHWHRLFKQLRQQTALQRWQSQSFRIQNNRLLSAAASPADPYTSTAKLRQLIVVLDITDIKDLQSLIRQDLAWHADDCCESLVMCRTPAAPMQLYNMRTPDLLHVRC